MVVFFEQLNMVLATQSHVFDFPWNAWNVYFECILKVSIKCINVLRINTMFLISGNNRNRMFCCLNYGSVIVYGYILGIFIFSFMFLTQVWAVSGERRGNSGSKRGSIPLKWATLVVTPQTRPMRRCAQVCLWLPFPSCQSLIVCGAPAT